ncbi:putative protein EXORDIUM [Dioscorea sansibarensis]
MSKVLNSLTLRFLLLLLFLSTFLITTTISISNSNSNSQLIYHKGPLLTSPINIYLTWYGSFSPTHFSTISSFFSSFSSSSSSISHWWSITQSYKNLAGKPPSTSITLAGTTHLSSTLGKSLTRSNLITILNHAISKGSLPLDPTGIYFVLTAADVAVERFCMGSCGFHAGYVEVIKGREKLVVAHVGDPGQQCPGTCAWPYAVPAYGPPGPALVAPNGVGVDGMVMNLATVMAGAATNPAGDGWYQGDRLAPLEAVTACRGVFGAGAYPGYPGELAVDHRSGASFNAYGAGGRKHLVPAMWDPVTGTCKVVTAAA